MSEEASRPQAGNLIGEHRVSWRRLAWRVVFGGAMLALAAVLIVARRVEGPPLFALLTLIALFILLLVGLWQLAAAARLLWIDPHLVLYDVGLRYVTRRREKRWRWERFSALRNNARVHRLLRIPILATGGWSLYIDGKRALRAGYDFQRARALGDALEIHTAEVIWPRYTDAFHRGKKLSFGRISANQDRIWQGRKEVRWADMTAWEAREGDLILTTNNGKTTRFRMRGAPNAHVLLMLVESVSKYR